MESFDDLIRGLEISKGDIQVQAALSASYFISSQSEASRELAGRALDAAAVLHWINLPLLQRMLAFPDDAAAGASFSLLQPMPFMEPFKGDCLNVHETTRLGWRRRLAEQSPERFKSLSFRAAGCFDGDESVIGRIERVYHLLCGEPETGARELIELDAKLTTLGHPEHRHALARLLGELEATKLLAGRPRLWALLSIAWFRSSREEYSELQEMAQEALALAISVGDKEAEAGAKSLWGDVCAARGDLTNALAAYRELREICQLQVEQCPEDFRWLRELAVAYSRIGGVLEVQEKFSDAQEAFAGDLEISKRLLEKDPSNPRWQRDLAVTYSRLGGVLEAQGNLESAQAAFEADLRITRAFAERDPSNAGWLRDLAVSCSRIGGVLEAQGKLLEALEAFEEDLRISRHLSVIDPGHLGWKHELAISCCRLGDIRQRLERLGEAQDSFSEYLTICQSLVQLDLPRVEWQHMLAVAYGRLGRVLKAQGVFDNAEVAIGASLRIYETIADRDASNALFRNEWADRLRDIGEVFRAQGRVEEEMLASEKELRIRRDLVDDDPMRAERQLGLARSYLRVARRRTTTESPEASFPLYAEASRILHHLLEGSQTRAGLAEESSAVDAEMNNLSGNK